MKATINLASEPFRRDRPILIASAAVGVILLLTLGVLVSLFITDRRDLKQGRAALDQATRRQAALTAEQRKLDSDLRQPANAEVLERSVFLNSLLYRKGISWTKIFADLEKTVPNNVRIISIQPQVNSQDQIFLQMVVGADAPEHAINFFAKLEASEFFGSTAVSSVIPPSQTDPLYRYRLSVNYAQKF